jgi:hypothetical protein
LIYKLAAVIAVKLLKREGDARVDVLKGVKCPAVGLVGQGIQANPAGGDIGGGQGKEILARSGLPAMVNGAGLDKSGQFPLL